MGGYPRLPGQEACKCRIQDRPPKGEVGGVKLSPAATSPNSAIFEAEIAMHHTTSA